MAQGVLPFQYGEGKVDESMTSHAGLFIYLDLFKAAAPQVAEDVRRPASKKTAF